MKILKKSKTFVYIALEEYYSKFGVRDVGTSETILLSKNNVRIKLKLTLEGGGEVIILKHPKMHSIFSKLEKKTAFSIR